jgi:DNA-binding CsgD family transcriptional regulator/tetratricopeptide (TPR) repeat protein
MARAARATPDASGAMPPPSAEGATVDAQRSSRRALGVFVGRQAEMAALSKALEEARGGQGCLVMLAGSGGMGKTRLARELAARAEADGVSVLWGRCLEEPGAPPYWPWRQLIRHYLRSGRDADAAQTFGAGLDDIAGIVPELLEQFPALRPGAAAHDTAQSRFRLFDAMVAFWRRAAQRAPLLLVFEDLHWADATSLRLFAFLAAELEDSRLLVIGTYRDTELSRQHPLFETLAELARSAVFHRLELTGLSGRETEAFVAAAGFASVSASLLQAMHERTEGHPLFLEETLRFMREQGDWQADGSIGEEPRWLTSIPSGVREVIGKRLNRLSVPAGRLLSTAACIGRTFDLDLLARLEVERSEEEIERSLEEALAVHLIEPVPQGQQFRFSHALIRETLYDEMLGLRRARLHWRIGEMLEQRHGADDRTVLPQLAYHFSEAGPAAAQKALAYARRSAEQAARVLALEEAARLYRLALQLEQQHFAGDATQRCALLLSLGEVELSLGAGEPARAVHEEAANLAREHGLAVPFAQAAAGFERSNVVMARSGEPAVALLSEAIALHRVDDPLRVELLARLCRAYVFCDRADEAKRAHRRAVELARRIGDPNGLYLALASIAAGIYWPDMLAARLAAAREAWSIAEARGLALSVVDLLPFFLADLIHAGDIAELRRRMDEGMRLAEQTRAPYLQTLCRHTEALVAINEGRFAQAESWATQALESGRRISEDQAASAYGMQMFCLRREQGRLREALPLLQHFVRTTPEAQVWQPGLALLYAELDMRTECREQFDALPWSAAARAPIDASSTTVFLFVAEVCVYLGDAARAALLYPLLQAHAGTNLLADFGGPCLGSADRLLGNLAGVLERWDVAQRHFESALAMDRQTGSRVWLVHTRHAYAVMLHRRGAAGDLARARVLLDEALAESSALGMQALTPRIAALAGALARPAPSYPCGLTEREVEVLRLMAIGRNNREIGQVLAISPNTVANHVRSILEKTYTANRTEAAAFARRADLLSG